MSGISTSVPIVVRVHAALHIFILPMYQLKVEIVLLRKNFYQGGLATSSRSRKNQYTLWIY